MRKYVKLKIDRRKSYNGVKSVSLIKVVETGGQVDTLGTSMIVKSGSSNNRPDLSCPSSQAKHHLIGIL